MGFHEFIFLGGVGCGALIRLFLDFTAPHGLNRKHPGASNKIQLDTLQRKIATSKVVF